MRKLTALSALVLSPLLLLDTATAAPAKKKESSDAKEAIEQPTVENLPLLLEAVYDASHCFPKPTPASEAVKRLGKSAVPMIVQRVKERRGKSWSTQVDNLFLLAQIGPDAKPSLTILTAIADSPKTHKYVRQFARAARAAIREDVDTLARLASAEVDYGHAGLLALTSLGPKAKSAGPALLEVARKRPASRKRYLAALEAIDPQLADALVAEADAAK